MKRHALILFILLLSGIACAQDLDSLRRALQTAVHDTDRIKALNALSEFAPDGEWEKYNEAMIKLSEANANKKSTNGSLKIFYLKSLASGLSNAGLIHYNKGEYPKALEYHNRALKIQEDIGDKKGCAATLNNIGLVYGSRGETEKTLECYERALKLHEETGDKKSLAMIINNIAYIYQNTGNMPRASEYHHKSLKIFEQMGYKSGIAMSLSNLSFISVNQSDTVQGLKYLEASLRIREEIGDKKGISSCYNNLGYIYQNRNQTDKALDYHFKSLKLKEELGDKAGLSLSYGNIGSIYKGIEDQKGKAADYSKAIEYYTKSLKLKEELGDKSGTALMLNNIAVVKINEGKIAEAKVLSEKAMALSEKTGFPIDVRQSAHSLRMIYERLGNYEKALEMYKLFRQMRDSINNQETRKATIKSEMQYAYEKKAATDSLKAESDKRIILAQIRQNENQTYFLYGGLGLTLIFGGLMFSRFRVTQKQKSVIVQQTRVLNEQTAIVEEKQKEIIDSIRYARRIQKSLMPSEKYFEKFLRGKK